MQCHSAAESALRRTLTVIFSKHELSDAYSWSHADRLIILYLPGMWTHWYSNAVIGRNFRQLCHSNIYRVHSYLKSCLIYIAYILYLYVMQFCERAVKADKLPCMCSDLRMALTLRTPSLHLSLILAQSMSLPCSLSSTQL